MSSPPPSSWEAQYEADYAKQQRSGPVDFTPEHKAKNIQLRDRVRDILPIDDDNKINDCDLLYRFLIGRHWNVTSAEQFLRKYVQLRHDRSLNGILAEQLDPRVEEILSPIFGVDKENLPVMWMTPDPAKLLPVLKDFDKNTLVRGQMHIMERARYAAKQLGVDRCTYVCNLGKITMSSVNTMTLGFLRDLTKILQEYYPEIMRRLLIFNTGWAVSAGWKVLRPFVDARVQDKIRFSNTAPSVDSLGEFMTSDNVLPCFGGTSTRDDVGDIINAEVSRLRSALEGGGGSVGADDIFVDEALLYSFDSYPDRNGSNNTNSAAPSCAEEYKESTVMIGSRGALRGLADLTLNDDASSEASESVDYEPYSPERKAGNSVPGAASASHASPASPVSPAVLCMDMMHTADGSITGYVQHRAIAAVKHNLIYAFMSTTSKRVSVADNDDSGGDSNNNNHYHASNSRVSPPPPLSHGDGSGAAAATRVLAGELLKESGHPIHHYVVICDTTRGAHFIIRKSRLRNRLTIFRVAGDAGVVTDNKMRHFITGDRHKWGVALPHKSTGDAGAWMLYAAKNCRLVAGGDDSNTNSNNNNGKSLLAECRGQSVWFHRGMASRPPVDLFAMAAAVTLLWGEQKDAVSPKHRYDSGDSSSSQQCSPGRGIFMADW